MQFGNVLDYRMATSYECINRPKLKGVFSGEGSFGEKLKNATIVGFKKRLRPIKKDKVAEKGDSITEVTNTVREQAEEIVQDIEDEVAGENRAKRQAFKDHRYPNMLWSEGVNYYFHKLASRQMRSSFEKRSEQLWDRIRHQFTRKPILAKDRIMVFPEDGCWSYVGKLGGEQKLSLGSGCETVSIAAHELGHALGFFHTMSRHDRDDFITVNKHNIKVSVRQCPY
ncbi:astacin [Cooperia oncophora]